MASTTRPKPPPDAPTPAPTEPQRHADEPDSSPIDEGDDSDTFGPRISRLTELLGDAALLADDDGEDDLLLLMMRAEPARRPVRPRTLH